MLNHDFGYGNPNLKEINKLMIKDVEELKNYLFDVIENAFINFQNNIIIELI